MGGSESKEDDQVSPVIDSITAKAEADGGSNAVKPLRLLSPFPPKQLFLGLENYGNTCYCNSVLQLLLNCEALRQRLRTVHAEFYDGSSPHLKGGPPKNAEETILSRLSELCHQLDTSRKKKGAIGPSHFVQKVKRENAMFRSSLQQDAHEFAIYVLNAIVDDEKQLLQIPPNESGPIQRLFEGHTVAETVCLDCETKSTRPEPFLALSIDVDQNQSLSHCLKNFSVPEYLTGEDKFRCDPCSCPTIARRAIRLHQAPTLLLIHLKRFKYIEGRNVFRKLAHRIAFPDHLGLPFNRGTNAVDSPLLGDGVGHHPALVHYRLSGFVVHHGAGPNVGHYTACCRADDGRTWRRFDDDTVSILDDHEVEQYFGYSIPTSESSVTATAYILLYSLETETG